MYVIKANGKKEEFNPEKIRSSGMSFALNDMLLPIREKIERNGQDYQTLWDDSDR